MAELLLALLHIPSYIVQISRVLFPRRPRGPPALLQAGQLIDATSHAHRISKDTVKLAEDVVIWPEDTLAIFSTDPGRPVFNAFTGEGDEAQAGNGAVKVLHLANVDGQSTSSPSATGLHIENWPEGHTFHPLGINVLETVPGTQALLGIVNCTKKQCFIELVRLEYTAPSEAADGTNAAASLKATHLYTFKHPSIKAPNALVVLSENQILFTNSYKYTPRESKLLFSLEQYLALPVGSVELLTRFAPLNDQVLCDRIVSGIALANGLAMNASRTVLAVASTTATYVKLYDGDMIPEPGIVYSPTHSICKLRRVIHVGMAVDNLRFCPTPDAAHASTGKEKPASETLLCAGHPSGLDFVKVAKNPRNPYRSPSRVVKVKVAAQPEQLSLWSRIKDLFARLSPEAQLVFESTGHFYGTSSTAVGFRQSGTKTGMLVCGLFEEGALACNDVDVST